MKKIYLGVSLLLGMLGMSSCDDFLEAYSQSMTVAKTVDNLDEVLIGSIYLPSAIISTGPMGGTPGGFFNILDDDVNTGRGEAMYNNTSMGWNNCVRGLFGYFAWQSEVGYNYNKTSTADDSGTWNTLYARINYVNVLLDEISGIATKTDDEIATGNRVRGEAHFLRAQFYFTLANLYGKAYNPKTCGQDLCVPLKLTPYVEHDKDKDTQFRRATVKAIYEQIVDDLTQAEEFLSQSPQNESHRLHRASLEAVDLLFSRVYLYMQEWEKAEQKADVVINSRNSSLSVINMLIDTEAFLTRSNPEIIFSQGPNFLAPNSIMTGDPGDFCVTQELASLYDEKDRRADCFFGVSAITDSLSLTKKYERGEILSHISSSFTLRVAEAYLNKAEACAMQGGDKEQMANKFLNTLRRNRIENYENKTYSGETLVQQIRDERRKELCFEGHRWFDLRRYAVCEKYPYNKIITHVYNACAENNAFLYSQTFRLLEHDPAYTFAIPAKVLNFDKVPMENNPREEREPVGQIK